MFHKRFKFSIFFLTILYVKLSSAQCPWNREITELTNSCLCAYNLLQELSVQCDQVSFSDFFC